MYLVVLVEVGDQLLTRAFGCLLSGTVVENVKDGPRPRDGGVSGDNLPKTRSGKIMRRLLRVLAKGEEITQDISTLENPAILEQLKQAI